MKNRNFDYQQIPPFQEKKQVKNSNKCQSKKCYRYYLNKTKRDKNYSLQQTFKYIDLFYQAYKNKKDFSASERFEKTNYLLNRLTNLEYKSKNSFSVLTSIIISAFVSLFIAVLQISVNGVNYFELINNGLDSCEQIILSGDNFVNILVGILSWIVIVIIFLSPIIVIILYLHSFSKSIFSVNSYNIIHIMPYEIKIINKMLATYSEKYKSEN